MNGVMLPDDHRYSFVVEALGAISGFGFIRTPEGSEAFFRVRDYAADGAELRPGISVEFDLRESFDAKKGRDSLAAVNVRPV